MNPIEIKGIITPIVTPMNPEGEGGGPGGYH